MRKFLIFVVLALLIVAGIGFILVATTPSQSAGIHAPLGASERALIAQVPASAEAFAIIPTAAALDARLHANPVSRAAIESWKAHQPLPRPWMIGSADLVAWKSGKETRYLLRLDPFRAVIVRMYLMAGGNIGNTVLLNAPAKQPIDAATLSRIVDQASRLPAGDALVVQLESSRGAYPPISRPTATSVQVSDSEIRLTSVGPAPPDAHGLKAVSKTFPRSAILSASFASPPRVIGDLNRLFGAKVSTLLEDGGAICIYDVDLRKLLPRPLGVIVLPDDPQRRQIIESFRKAESIGIHTRTAEIGDKLVLSFDDSINRYQSDVFDPAPAGNQWTARLDPSRLVPILNDLGQNLGLRIAAPRLFRSARDLHEWISGLEQAKVIEASDSADSQGETLQVRISSK
ncbi:MAG TPA: hypothetical protein VII12_07855 [Thermoanaerobaculia bacterium]